MMPRAVSLNAFLPLVILILGDKGQAKQQSSFITPPDYFDGIRIKRNSVVADVEQLSTSVFRVTTNVTGVGEQSYRLVSIHGFLPFSDDSSFRTPVQNDAAALLLAVYHFNNIELNPIFQSSLDLSDCDVRFTATFSDTEVSPSTTTKRFMQVLRRKYSFTQPAPGAIVGAYRSAESAPLAIWTGVNGIPQVSYSSTSKDLDVKDQFPLFARTVTNTDGEAAAAVDLFLSFGSTNVGVLFVTDAYGSALQKSFQDFAANRDIQTTSIGFSFHSNEQEIANALASLKTTQFRHFYAICYEDHYASIMTAATIQNIVGGDFLWIFPGFDLMNIHNRLAFTPSSPLVNATSGIGIITMAGGETREKIIPGVEYAPPLDRNATSGFEKFRVAWRDAVNDPYISSAFRSKIIHDIQKSSIPGFSVEPSIFGPFVYDAVMALGASMCRAGKSVVDFTGVQVFDQLRQLEFNGASGRVLFDNYTATRVYKTMTYQLWNPVKVEALDENGQVRFEMVPTDYFHDGAWQQLPSQAFVFSGGATTPPPSLPPVIMNENDIGQPGRIFGYCLMGSVMLCSLISLAWLIQFRKERVVRASQPLFLVMISVGSFIMSLSIFPMTLDDSIVSKQSCLDSACMAAPLLYLVGCIIACSPLYAKARGVHQAFKNPDLHFIQVRPRDMVGGALCLLLLNSFILIPWTIADPLRWHRRLGSSLDIFGRPADSYGLCKSRTALPYAVAIVGLNLSLHIFFTIKTFIARNIETEYLESRYVSICLSSALQAWLMGIPILGVVWSNPKARFFVETGIVFVTAQAILLLIYVPKMLAVRMDRLLEAVQIKSEAYRRFSQRVKIPDEDDDGQRSGYGDTMSPTGEKKLRSRQNMYIKDLSVTAVTTDSVEESPSSVITEQPDEPASLHNYDGGDIGEAADVSLVGFEAPVEGSGKWRSSSSKNFDIPYNEEESKVEEVADDAPVDIPGWSIDKNSEGRSEGLEGPPDQINLQRRWALSAKSIRLSQRVMMKETEAVGPDVGVRVVFNPRSARNLRATGGREMSRAQLFAYMHQNVEGDSSDVPNDMEEGDEEDDAGDD